MLNTDWALSSNVHDLAALPNSSYGEWSSFQLLPDRFVNATLCFSTFYAGLSAVDMTAKGPLKEPSASWTVDGIRPSMEATGPPGYSTGHSQKGPQASILTYYAS
ncbi:hypothetical protein GGR53DRAFT_532158 [Hypoxylon sp. FL1150]|nr:hypothetical protein GGR53DRAFT_532158 [Hypoxylon sp. FL1150]